MTVSMPSLVRLSSQSGLTGPMNWTSQSCLPLVTLWRRLAGTVGTPLGVVIVPPRRTISSKSSRWATVSRPATERAVESETSQREKEVSEGGAIGAIDDHLVRTCGDPAQ